MMDSAEDPFVSRQSDPSINMERMGPFSPNHSRVFSKTLSINHESDVFRHFSIIFNVISIIYIYIKSKNDENEDWKKKKKKERIKDILSMKNVIAAEEEKERRASRKRGEETKRLNKCTRRRIRRRV